MREYRGRCVDVDEDYGWVYGYYVNLKDAYKNREAHRIYSGFAEADCGDFFPDWYKVDPNTVGQFTGLFDKNGKKIFEGDIVIYKTVPMVVKWDDESAQFFVAYNMGELYCENTLYGHGKLEVVGNIHDNPELISELTR